MNSVFNRRRFLQAVGATALTYPFLRGLPSYAADGGGDRVYLVLLFTPCGVVRFKWGAQGAPASLTTPTVTPGPLMFRETLSAFTKAGPSGVDLTDQMILLDGLTNAAGQGGSHEGGMASLWTATPRGAPGPSIDQVIAKKLNAPTPYASIPLMVRSSADDMSRQVDTRMLYAADASGKVNFVDPYDDPVKTLNQLFPGAAKMMGSGPDKMTVIRQKVHDQRNSELTSLQSRLCTDDRAQLQNLQDLWNQVELQLQNAAMQAAMCSVPSIGDAGAVMGMGASDPFPARAQAMMGILTMALACDLTRVASLQFSQALSPATHYWVPSVANDTNKQTHHSYSHMGPASFGALGPDIYNEPAFIIKQYPQQLIDIDAWYAGQVATFAAMLKQQNILDKTVVCWGSEIDMGAAHNTDDMPFVLIGGGAGKLKTNTLVRFPMNLSYMKGASVRFHNDLHLTLAAVMGVDLGGKFGADSGSTQDLGPVSPLNTGVIKEILT